MWAFIYELKRGGKVGMWVDVIDCVDTANLFSKNDSDE